MLLGFGRFTATCIQWAPSVWPAESDDTRPLELNTKTIQPPSSFIYSQTCVSGHLY